MAAIGEEDVSALKERVEELSVVSTTAATADMTTDDGTAKSENDTVDTTKSSEPLLGAFETRELYKLALNFYKGKLFDNSSAWPSFSATFLSGHSTQCNRIDRTKFFM